MAEPAERRQAVLPVSERKKYVSLLFFGLMNLTKETDKLLLRRRLWRNHHRVLDALSRDLARSMSELAERVDASKQALHKSIQGLVRAGFVQVEVDPLHRRAKSVKLTPAGRRFEGRLDVIQEDMMERVAAKMGVEAMQTWAVVMEEIAKAQGMNDTADVPEPPRKRRRESN